MSKEIRTFIAKRDNEGLTTTREDVIIAFRKNGISPVTISHCYNQICLTISGGEALNYAHEEDYETPEEAYLNKEKEKIISESFSCLSESEKNVIILKHAIFRSDISLLDNILRNVANYSSFDILRANGMNNKEALRALGFTNQEIWNCYKLTSKEKVVAEKFLNQELDHSSKEVSDLLQKLNSKKAETKFNNDVSNKFLVSVLVNNGHSSDEANDIVNGKHIDIEVLKTLKPISELGIRNLLMGKGFNYADIEEILTGYRFDENESDKDKSKVLKNEEQRNLSIAKVARILPFDKKTIGILETNAVTKLKEYLSEKLNDNKKTKTDIIANMEEINEISDNLNFINAWYDEINMIEDLDEMLLEEPEEMVMMDI